MKVLSALTAIFVLISCIASTILVTADQEDVGDDQVDDGDSITIAPTTLASGAQEDAGDDQVDENYSEVTVAPTTLVTAVQEDAGADQVDDNYSDGDIIVYSGFTVCDDTAIQVQDVQLYCDSPGTFYYGSGKYRNSKNCTAGDKGKYLVDFYIRDADTIETTGGFPVLDISAAGNSIGWYDSNQKLFENEDLCSHSSLKSLSGSVCPAEGKYRISSNFYWEDDGSYNGVFYPTLTVGFKSSEYANSYDYGGANTPYCSGTSFFTSWTNSAKKVYANSLGNFFKTFGILSFTITVMLSFIWLMVNKPISFQDASTKIGFRKRNRSQAQDSDDDSSGFRKRLQTQDCDDDSSYANSDNFDFDKIKSQTSDFLDF